jgi:hypothetical protein
MASTEADILKAGIEGQGEDNASNYGHFTLSMHSGTYELTQSDGEHSHDLGSYLIQGTTIVFTTSGAELFAYPFRVSATALTLLPILTSTGAIDFTRSGAVTLRTKPWTRIGP